MTVTAPFLSRHERFERVGSTNDVVRDWLAAGTPEVCLAVTAEQTAGRGREGRTWVAPPRAALLLSVGFRPGWLGADLAWRLPAVVGLAMAEAAEAAAGLPEGTIRLKWPNDLVIADRATVRKLAGVLGESVGLGTTDPHVIVGIGVNGNWRRADFPPDLAGAMTSLMDANAGRPVDVGSLLDAFLSALEGRVRELRDGRFDATAWAARQVTTGRRVVLQLPDGWREDVDAVGVDDRTGALLVDDGRGRRAVFSGEIRHLRFASNQGRV